jgi:hypothetical protein
MEAAAVAAMHWYGVSFSVHRLAALRAGEEARVVPHEPRVRHRRAARTHAHAHARAHARARARAHASTRTHSCERRRAQRQTSMHTHARTHASTPHAHTRARALRHNRPRPQPHALTHPTHTSTYTHARGPRSGGRPHPIARTREGRPAPLVGSELRRSFVPVGPREQPPIGPKGGAIARASRRLPRRSVGRAAHEGRGVFAEDRGRAGASRGQYARMRARARVWICVCACVRVHGARGFCLFAPLVVCACACVRASLMKRPCASPRRAGT